MRSRGCVNEIGRALAVPRDDGATVGEVLKGLDAAHPGFGERIFDEGGKLRRFVNVFVDDEDLRFLQGLDTPLTDRSVVSIVPAVAGG